MNTYIEKYGDTGAAGVDLRGRADEFADWHVDVPFPGGVVRLLCCPEDRVCGKKTCQSGSRCWCQDCTVPVCRECMGHLNRRTPCMPPAALTNDLMIFYAPEVLYTRNVTIMEMICASVCLMSMICFTME